MFNQGKMLVDNRNFDVNFRQFVDTNIIIRNKADEVLGYMKHEVVYLYGASQLV